MEPPKVDRTNIYPEASQGRLKTTDAPASEESRIISKNVEGSEGSERTEEFIRRNDSIRLDDKLLKVILCVGTLIGAFAFISSKSNGLTDFFQYPLYGSVTIFVGFIVYYIVRRISIAKKSHDYKKKNQQNSK